MVAKVNVKQTNVLIATRDNLVQKCAIILNAKIKTFALNCSIKMMKKMRLMFKVPLGTTEFVMLNMLNLFF